MIKELIEFSIISTGDQQQSASIMAGFLIAIGHGSKGLSAIKRCVKRGIYSTIIKVGAKNKQPFAGTMADYCSMKEGDSVFFFSKRKIYGIGKIVSLGPDCKLKNYPASCRIVFRAPSYKTIKNLLLEDDGSKSAKEPWLFAFEPNPDFYSDGVDMDDVLEYKPNTFKAIRTFWKKSFTKMDDEESDSLSEFLRLRNQNKGALKFSGTYAAKIRARATNSYIIDPEEAAAGQTKANGSISQESTIEACVIDALMKGKVEKFGRWDYVTHQLCASPFKPIDYMDRIDVFAYRTIPGTRAISKFLVIELKKDEAPDGTISQIGKYVDYVCKNYAFGDYGRIEAMIIAHSFDAPAVKKELPLIQRNYIVGSHPTISSSWRNLRFFEYSFSDGLKFKEVNF